MTRPCAGALRVARREFRSALRTPSTYAISVAFLVLTGVLFYLTADGGREASLRFWFPNLTFVLLVTAPVITSRVVAEEWRTRHLDVLLSRGVGPGALVVGKWLSAVGLLVVLVLPTGGYVWFLGRWGKPDYPPLLVGYVGALCAIAVFCAVGTLASALTPTAVAAGLASFAVLVGAQLADGVPVIGRLSFQPHVDAFSRGAPRLADVVYFGSVSVGCLILATAAQVGRLGVVGRLPALAGPGAALAVALGVNLIPLPADAEVDLTANSRFSLSDASEQVLAGVTTPVRITVFEPTGSGEARDAKVLLDEFGHRNARVTGRVLDITEATGEAARLGARDSGDVAVEADGRHEVLSPLTEQGVTSAVYRLIRPVPQVACALAGHGERELDDGTAGGYRLAREAME
ncbi:MAG: ABC transporter permease subunit, partial [Actinobacteria bacterium]|nr:ABC transporter permease subunit [Actinomycetota bacterium]